MVFLAVGIKTALPSVFGYAELVARSVVPGTSHLSADVIAVLPGPVISRHVDVLCLQDGCIDHHDLGRTLIGQGIHDLSSSARLISRLIIYVLIKRPVRRSESGKVLQGPHVRKIFEILVQDEKDIRCGALQDLVGKPFRIILLPDAALIYHADARIILFEFIDGLVENDVGKSVALSPGAVGKYPDTENTCIFTVKAAERIQNEPHRKDDDHKRRQKGESLLLLPGKLFHKTCFTVYCSSFPYLLAAVSV